MVRFVRFENIKIVYIIANKKHKKQAQKRISTYKRESNIFR